MNRITLSLAVWISMFAFGLPNAEAQSSVSTTPAFSIERLLVSPGVGNFISAQSARVLTPGHWSAGFTGSLMSRPIVLADINTGRSVIVPVKTRLGYEFGIARGISTRLQIGLALPVVAAQDGDRLQNIGLSEDSLAPIAVGDVRIHAKMRLGDLKARLSYGVGVYLALPTGDENNFAGEKATVLSWALLASYRRQRWRVAANLRLRLRTEEVILLSPARPHGNEVVGTVAAEYWLLMRKEFPLGGIAELTQVRGDSGGPSPGEVRLGLVTQVATRVRLKSIYGRGLTPDEIGSPGWRVATIVEFK